MGPWVPDTRLNFYVSVLEFPAEPEAVSPKSDTTLITQTAIVPGSGLPPSQPASAGTTGTGSHESSRAPPLATTATLEPTASPSLGIPGQP